MCSFGEHVQRCQLAVAQVVVRVDVIYALSDGFLFVEAGEDVLALLAHYNSGSGIWHIGRRTGGTRILQKLIGNEFVIVGFFTVFKMFRNCCRCVVEAVEMSRKPARSAL